MYQALYRVWRPQAFQDMVGQGLITQTLKNAVVSDKVSHAYLFTGSRGTGKTSAAKIFAKAINCQQKVDGEPCNSCESCKSITDGSSQDVIEIDAASNNGVEEIRDIRDKSRYAPTQSLYKVYIIDEVHMLSTGAFNALLKTLEEPTAFVIFILATTEPHKIPATILSRVQRFDFKRIGHDEIVGRMQEILNKENITYEETALSLIAKAANGGMRDALSLLDQVISYGNGHIDDDHAIEVTGSLSQQWLTQYLTYVFDKQREQALDSIQSLLSSGKESSRIVEELLLFVRDILVAKVTNHITALSAQAQTFSQRVTEQFLYACIEQLSQTQAMLRQTTQKDIYLDVLTVKLTQDVSVGSSDSGTIQETVAQLQQEIMVLRDKVNELSTRTPERQMSVQNQMTVQSRKSEDSFEPNIAKIFNILVRATAQDKQRVQDDWPDILNCLSVSQRAKLNASTVLAASPEGVVIGFEYPLLCQMTAGDSVLQQEISEHAKRLIQHPFAIECVPLNQWKDVRDKFVQAKNMGTLSQYLSEAISEKVANEESESVFLDDEEMLDDVPDIVKQATVLFGDIVEVE